jgi:predicted lipoprotein
MDQKLIKSICAQVYRRFPEVAGNQPQVRQQASHQAKSVASTPTYLLTFQGTVEAQDGKSIVRVVRVIASAKGKILKVTTSR